MVNKAAHAGGLLPVLPHKQTCDVSIRWDITLKVGSAIQVHTVSVWGRIKEANNYRHSTHGTYTVEPEHINNLQAILFWLKKAQLCFKHHKCAFLAKRVESFNTLSPRIVETKQEEGQSSHGSPCICGCTITFLSSSCQMFHVFWHPYTSYCLRNSNGTW